MASTETKAEDIRWDLSDLCDGADEARAQWQELTKQAEAIAARTRGRIAELDAAALRALLDEVDELEQELSRLNVY